MTGDLFTVKKYDRDIISIPREELGILRDVDNFDREFDLLTTALDYFLGEIAQMAIRLGIDGDFPGHFSHESRSQKSLPLAKQLREAARLVPVMFRFVRTFDRHAKIVGLFLREFRELDADLFKVQARDFFVELLGQTINSDLIRVFVLP